VKTYPLPGHRFSGILLLSCSRRAPTERRTAKDHRYFTVVENRRISARRPGKTVQRTVLYLGESNDQQQAAWRKTLAVFDEQQQPFTDVSLFPEDRLFFRLACSASARARPWEASSRHSTHFSGTAEALACPPAALV
jgi:hypothetical protein